mmetsp:Transcript_25077/g.59712  ORF Transcript_25077/g.59712 Transcript_25077/m.59712 type:complete len:339 (-) Transcript_25077:2635-3651(-)
MRAERKMAVQLGDAWRPNHGSWRTAEASDPMKDRQLPTARLEQSARAWNHCLSPSPGSGPWGSSAAAERRTRPEEKGPNLGGSSRDPRPVRARALRPASSPEQQRRSRCRPSWGWPMARRCFCPPAAAATRRPSEHALRLRIQAWDTRRQAPSGRQLANVRALRTLSRDRLQATDSAPPFPYRLRPLQTLADRWGMLIMSPVRDQSAPRARNHSRRRVIVQTASASQFLLTLAACGAHPRQRPQPMLHGRPLWSHRQTSTPRKGFSGTPTGMETPRDARQPRISHRRLAHRSPLTHPLTTRRQGRAARRGSRSAQAPPLQRMPSLADLRGRHCRRLRI